jgi:hypothetical protein
VEELFEKSHFLNFGGKKQEFLTHPNISAILSFLPKFQLNRVKGPKIYTK